MNAKQRPTMGAPLVAWQPTTTLTESPGELSRQTSVTSESALIAARLRNVSARVNATADAIESGRISNAVTAQLAAGWVDTITRLMAELVVAR